MIWQNVRWEDGNPDSAAYACSHCGVLWTDSDRRWSIRNGRWFAEQEFKGVAGFYINGLYSPWTPLADGVRDFLSMKKNPEQLRVWTNTYLGESWEDEGEQVDDFSLYERREDFKEAIPEEVVFLTAGVDVQDNRLEASIIGWARDQESYVIDHKVMYGDPSTPQLWTQLDSLVGKTYETYDGRQMAIRATCIDSGGHFTNSVYQYAKKNAGKRVFAIKGVGGEGRPIAGRPTKNNVVRCPLFPIGVDTVKDLLFARMRIEEPGPGYIHFNEHLDDEYFRQLTAEKIVTRFHRGFKKRVFQKVRARNESLDCFVYAIGAFAILNIDINTLADKAKIKDNVVENISSESKAKPRKPPFVPRVGSGFVNSWR